MARKSSAGILLYRCNGAAAEVLLVHPGGPFWTKKDAGAWSIPKGEFTPEEDPLLAAQREFQEETGQSLTGPFVPLGSTRQSGGKVVHAWASRGDFDPTHLTSNLVRMLWPPGSARWLEFPEVDRAEWFSLPAAREKLISAQVVFIDRLATLLQPT